MNKLYYCKDEGQFYLVKQTPKTIKIDWITKFNCDSEKTELDQKVKWKNLVVKKDNSNKHCLKKNNETGILIYPFQAGLPFYLEPATIKDIDKEIADCVKWGVSSEYYKNLKQYILPLDKQKSFA
ncbi:MAG: hypothetical protein ABII16_03545 [Patescibacteria group bacterium]